MPFKKLLRDRSGNFGMMTALLMVPLVGAAGLAVDVSTALEQRSQMLNAADAAAAGVLSTKAASVTQAMLMSGDGTVGIGGADAIRLFKAQLPSDLQAELVDVKIDINKTGNVLTSSLQFTATMPTSFMQILGQKQMTFSGVATGTYQTTAFIDFYMLLDNSPSMGVGATSADVALMEKKTTDSCAFACHDVSNANNYYNLAKSLGVTMRIDTVREATQQLTETASRSSQVNGQYRMAVYTFGEKAESMGLHQVAPMSSDLATVKTNAGAIDLMTVPNQNYNNDQDTSYDTMLSGLKSVMGTGGNGTSSSDRQKVLFFVGDGVGDSAKSACTKATTNGTRCQEPIDVSYCKALKAQNIKIAVLYTTYLPLPKNGWYNDWIKPFQSQIATNMQSCASPGLYFEVTPTDGISDAMNALFQKVIASPRLTG